MDYTARLGEIQLKMARCFRIRYSMPSFEKCGGFLVIDQEGYRYNVAIVLVNQQGKVLLARRSHQHSWQFAQGGLQEGETPLVALYRELYEELGLRPWDVKVEAVTQGWLKYQLPDHLRRSEQNACIGQKQKWFLLRLLSVDSTINLSTTNYPEFDRWRWVEYWYPLSQVIPFKRHVYRRALERFYPFVKGQ